MKKFTRSLIAVALLLITGFSAQAQGMMSTLVGAGGIGAGYSGDGGLASAAQINSPNDICFDANNNLYFVDNNNYVIRKIDATTGIITTVAGNATMGYSGDGGQATAAQFTNPAYMCISGNYMYVTDGRSFAGGYGSNTIRKINMTTGIITTIAGTNNMDGFSGDGGPSTAALISGPTGIDADAAGNIYFVDGANNRVRRIDAQTGIITTIAGTGNTNYSGDGGLAVNAELYTPTVLEVDNDGNIYLADYIGMRLRKIDAGTGIINTISSMGAGLVDGPLINSGIGMVWGITCDDNDDVYITDESCSCRKITTSTGMINIVAGDLVMEGFNGETGIATQIWFNRPMGLAVHPQTGDIIVADLWNNRIRMATQPDYEAPENPVSHGSEVGTGVGTPAEWTPTTVPVVTGSPAVNIYPNPSSGRFTMQNNSGKEMNINVFNNTGSLVYTTAVKGTEVSVDLGNQPAGVYHLVADGHNAGKIVVTK